MDQKIKKITEELFPYIIIVLVVVLIRTFIITPVQVNGTSMVPTFSDNQVLLLKKYDHNYERFDIVVFKYNKDTLIKRIIGLPGEYVKYKDNNLYINEKKVSEDFVVDKTEDFELLDINKKIIPEGYYFVVGDNRDNSKDSRYIGLISEKQIKGKPIFSIFPFEDFGTVK